MHKYIIHVKSINKRFLSYHFRISSCHWGIPKSFAEVDFVWITGVDVCIVPVKDECAIYVSKILKQVYKRCRTGYYRDLLTCGYIHNQT